MAQCNRGLRARGAGRTVAKGARLRHVFAAAL